jgi:hypothetical protein
MEQLTKTIMKVASKQEGAMFWHLLICALTPFLAVSKVIFTITLVVSLDVRNP